MEKKSKGGWRFLRRWGLLLLALVALDLFFLYNAHVKEKAQGIGYCPAAPAWIVTSEDFGWFWGNAARCDAVTRFEKEVKNPLKEIELAIRKNAGIRPTPARWRLWMGNRLLAARTPEGLGLSTYPGILLRAVDTFRQSVLGYKPESGVLSLGPYYYAWREGFLIVSCARPYVEASLAAAPPVADVSHERNEMTVQWCGSRKAMLRLSADDSVPVSGWLEADCRTAAEPLGLADAWPDSPLLSVTAHRWKDIVSLLTALDDLAPDAPGQKEAQKWARQLWDQWRFGQLKEGWEEGSQHCSLAITGVSGDVIPVPSLAFIMRYRQPYQRPHPLAPLTESLLTIPHEWEGEPGFVAPLAGEEFSLCLGRQGRDWLAASQEPLLAKLAATSTSETGPASAVALRLNWKKAGGAAEQLLRLAGQAELLSPRNSREVEAQIAPWVRAVGRLGTLQIDGTADTGSTAGTGRTADTGRIVFKGVLARRSPQDEDKEDMKEESHNP